MAENYSIGFWRPNKAGNGAGSIFSLNEQGQAWLKVMPQSGEKKFNSEAAINVKLGQADIGAMLSVLTGQTEGIGTKNEKGFWSGLLHTFNDNTTSLGLSVGQNNPGFYLTVSKKVGKDGTPVRLGNGLSWGDGQCLRVFLERAAWASMFDTFRQGGPEGADDTEEGNEAPAASTPAPAPSKATPQAAGSKPRGRPPVAKQTATPVGASTDSGGNVPF